MKYIEHPIIFLTVFYCGAVCASDTLMQAEVNLSTHQAAKRNNRFFFEQNIEKIDLQKIFKDGALVLNLAVSHGHCDLAEYLIKKGSDPNQADISGKTSLHWAMLAPEKFLKRQQIDRINMVELLLKMGADPNRLTKNKESPLYIAAYKGYSDIAELLLRAGANINQQDNRRATPLFVATRAGQKNCVELLLKWGADVHVTGDNNNTSLHLAYYSSNQKIIDMLLGSGASLEMKNADGCIPQDFAFLKRRD